MFNTRMDYQICGRSRFVLRHHLVKRGSGVGAAARGSSVGFLVAAIVVVFLLLFCCFSLSSM